MLNIYYGRENLEKERFMYDKIREAGFGPDRRILILVPDQYTLEEERQAFHYLGQDSLIGLDVLGMSRLGQNALVERGGAGRRFINRYGRQMLLTAVCAQLDDELEIYRNSGRRPSFIDMVNDFISQMKQYDVTPDMLRTVADRLNREPKLSAKLRDLSRIWSVYEEKIAGKYTDSEDRIALYTEKIRESGQVTGANVWVYGFESFAPKSLGVLQAVLDSAASLNVILTCDRDPRYGELFALTRGIMTALRAMGRGHAGVTSRIPEEYLEKDTAPAPAWIEQELFADRPAPAQGEPAGLTLVEAANFYQEAESAAAHILHLLRDCDYRFRDIAVICNDQTVRLPILRRVFGEYGLSAFLDAKRSILSTNPAVFLISSLTAVQKRMRSRDVFTALKTGLTGLDPDGIERLENYAIRYRIRGPKLWGAPFRKNAELTEAADAVLRRMDDPEDESASALVRISLRQLGASGDRLEDLLRAKDQLEEVIAGSDEAAGAERADQIRGDLNRMLMDLACLPGAGEAAEDPEEDPEGEENEAAKAPLSPALRGFYKILRRFREEYEKFGQVEELRGKVSGIFARLEQICRGKKTVAEFLMEFYRWLDEEMEIPARLQAQDQARDQSEKAAELPPAENIHAWNEIVGLLDQIADMTGEDPFRLDTFIQLLSSGLSQVEIGVLPSTVDDIMMGTMQRTRLRAVKAEIIVGANEGVLPVEMGQDGLFAQEELAAMNGIGGQLRMETASRKQGEGSGSSDVNRTSTVDDALDISMDEETVGHAADIPMDGETADPLTPIVRLDRVRAQEERLAIYRNLSLPSRELWISWSVSDSDGKKISPSDLIEDLRGLFPDLKVVPDIISGGREEDLIGGRQSTLRHLTRARRTGADSEIWRAAWDWFEEKPDYGSELDMIDYDLRFRNRASLNPDRASLLFSGSEIRPSISPSKLEKYASCPFSYYVGAGLRPQEQRIFEASFREIGEVFHACVLKVTHALSDRDAWKDISREEVRGWIDQVVRRESGGYRDGLFRAGGGEQYRMKRIEAACLQVIWTLIEQWRKGSIDQSSYEIGFGYGGELPAVEVPFGDRTAVIRGRIDRMDVLENGRIKIIDYKTGTKTLKAEDIRKGYSLQLMIYMKAAEGFDAKRRYDALEKPVPEEAGMPAGVYYFYLKEPKETMDGVDPDTEAGRIALEKSIRKSFVMNGLTVSDPETVREIAGDVVKDNGVVGVTSSASSGLSGSGLISEEDFRDLQEEVDTLLSDLVSRMASGRIEIAPMKSGQTTACAYCDFKGICRFEPGVGDPRYRE